MAILKDLIVNGISRFIGKVYIDDSHINTINGVSVTETPKFTDTTYESKAAAQNGTAVSLVTTGEKYTWNSKTSNTGTVTSITLKAGSGITLDTDNTAITTSGIRTISHADTSSQNSITAQERTYIKSVKLDTYGHVTELTTGQENVTDTTNTAGSTDISSKIFLIGATSQTASSQTYSHDTAYVGTDGHLYSDGKQVVNLSGTQALTNKTYNGYTLADASARGVDNSLLSGTTSTNLPTSKAVVEYISTAISASDAMIFKGTLGTGGNITALPNVHERGWTYRIITAGTYAGQKCEIGDLIIALNDRSSGTTTNADWTVAQTNIDGALTTAGGTMTGTLSWEGNTALPQFSGAPTYLLGIESFTNGGTTKWQSASNVTVGSATKATQDSDGNQINTTYIKKSVLSGAYDIMYSSAANTPTRLAANTTTTKKFLRMTGTGSAGTAPVWDTVTKSDVGLSNVENTALSTWTGNSNLDSKYKLVRPANAVYSLNNGIYRGGSGICTYARIELPTTVQTVFGMYYIEIDIRGDYNKGYGGKILINAYHNTTSPYAWQGFTASAIGHLPYPLEVYGSDGIYFYIKYNTFYQTVSVDKILVGDTASTSGYDLSATTISFVDSLPETYQTATMYYSEYPKAVNLTTTANAIAYYTNTTGTLGTKASANGALYATSANGELQWGTLPIAQGGTGATTAGNAINNLLGGLSVWSANPTDTTYFIRQDTGGAASYGKVPFSTLWSYIKGKIDNDGSYTGTGTVTQITAGTGLSMGTTAGGSTTTTGTINHTNSVTAQTQQAVYPIKIDAQGHISAYGSAVTSMTPTSHTHGNLSNDGKITSTATIANGDKLVIVDSDTTAASKITGSSITFDGSTTTKALTPKGTWETFNNYSLPLAASGTRGGVQIGYSESGKKYAVKLDNEKMYVEVPWTDNNTTYSAGTGLSLSGTTFNHKNSVTAGTAGTSSATSGTTTLSIPYITYDAQGHITGSGTHTHTINSFPEANLSWGGKNFSGNYGCIDAAMIEELGANRLAFFKAAGITIEYTRDNGETWVDYGATDAEKVGLFSNGRSFVIGKATNDANENKATANGTNFQLRVTLNTGLGGLYTVLNKFAIYVSTSGSSSPTVTIDKALQETPDTYTHHVEDVPISGWSGWNIINVSGITTYGNTAASQYGRIRFIFKANGGNTNYAGLSISKIKGFGGQGWTTPSNLAATGHLYSYNSLQEATFPAKVTATSFSGNLTGNVTGNLTGNVTGNVTGNASSATYTIGLKIINSSGAAQSGMNNRPTTANTNYTDGILRHYLATSSMTTGKPSSDGFILHFGWDNSGYNGQLALLGASGTSDNKPHLQLRGETGGANTWTDWNTVLDSDNFTNYALPLSGGTLTGGVTFVGNQSSAWNTKGIIFTNGSRIGEANTGSFGIYAAGGLYLRPNSGSSASTDGIEITTDGLYPTNNNTETLGKTNNKWLSVYATTFYGALSGNATSATTASKLGSSDVGSASRPIYLSGGTATQTTYRMAGTNVSATTALAITTNLETGIWYVNGTNSTDLYGQNDGAAYVNKYSDAWIGEIYQDYRTGQIALRGKNNGTWQAWRKVLDSVNYTTYALSINGGTVNGAVDIQNTLSANSASIGNLVVTGDATFTNGIRGDVTGNVSGSAGSVAWANVSGKPTATQSKTTGISVSNHTTTSIYGVSSSTTSVTGVDGSTKASKVTLGTEFTIPNVTNAGSASTWTFENITVPVKNASATTVPIAASSPTNVPIKNSSATSIPNVTNVGNASLTMQQDGVDNKKLIISFTYNAPTLGTPISIYGVKSDVTTVTGVSGSTSVVGVQSSTTVTASHVTGGGNGSAPTLGTPFSVPNVTENSEVTVPIAASSATTVPIKNGTATTVVTSATHTVNDSGHTHTIS